MKKVDSSSGVNRRNVIRAGLSALAAGLLLKFVGADSVTVDRVQGANGASIIIGASNTGSSITTLSSPVNGGPAAYFVNSGTGDAQAIQGNMTGTAGRAFVGYASATSGSTIAMDGVCNSPSGIALRGANTANGMAFKASSKGAYIGLFQNNATSGDRTALTEWQTGDTTPKSWTAGVGGANNGLGLTGGQFYFEKLGSGAQVVIDPAGYVLPGADNYWVLGKFNISNQQRWMNLHMVNIEIIGESGFTSINTTGDGIGNLGSSGLRWNNLYVITSHVGDLVFANQFRAVENGADALAFVNAKNQKIASLDSDGNLQIQGTLTAQKQLGQALPLKISEQPQGKPR